MLGVDTCDYFVNVQGNTEEHRLLLKTAKEKFKSRYLLTTPNQGRDIGAKLLLIDLLLHLDLPSEYTLIIHDKNSPHLGDGNYWREELFKIIDNSYVKTVFDTFANNSSVGIVCSKKYIQNEYNSADRSFSCNSNEQIKELLKKHKITTTDYNFVAGNIFWIRTGLLREFFSFRSILDIRAQLESGNALDFNKGTYIHSWERIMSWIATSQGYTIYGI